MSKNNKQQSNKIKEYITEVQGMELHTKNNGRVNGLFSKYIDFIMHDSFIGLKAMVILCMVLIIFIGMTTSNSYALGVVDGMTYKVYEAGTNNAITNIGENQKFKLKLFFNNTPLASNYPISVEVGGSNFQPSRGANMQTLQASETSVSFEMERIGNGNSLTVNLADSAATPNTEAITIYIEEAKRLDDDDDTPRVPKSKEQKDPDLKLEPSANVQTMLGAKKENLIIPLTVMEKTAKNIKITLDDKGEDFPFVLEDTKPWVFTEYVTKNGETLFMPVTVSPLAKSKVYSLKLKMEYENQRDDKYEKTETLYVKIQNDEIEPILSIEEYRFNKEKLNIYGGKQGIILTIKNSGTLLAKDVRVMLKGFSPDGVRLDGDIDTKIVPSIAAGDEEIVYFVLIPSETAKTSQIPLTVSLTYDDEVGNEYKKETEVYVPVAGQDAQSIDVEVDNIDVPNRVESGKEFQISFDITNKSGFEVNDIEMGLELPDGFVPASRPKIKVEKIDDTQTLHYFFNVMATDNLKKGYYSLYILANYKNSASASDVIAKEYVGVKIDGNTGRGRPKVLVKDYSFDGETVLAGEEFDLNLKFFNTSSNDIIKNMKVSVSSDDGVFSLVDSASSFFIESIGRNETIDKVLRLKTKKDATVKIYNLKLVMEYEDGQGNAYDSQEQPYKEEELLGIQVSQPERLEIGDIQVPAEVYVDSPANVEVEFYNMGKADMVNMFVILEGDFDVKDGKYFVGNFAVGNNEYYSGTFIPNKEGEGVGKLKFEFEDALGNISTVEKEFSYFAANSSSEGMESGGFDEFPDGNFDGDMEMGEGNKMPIYKNTKIMYPTIAIIVIIAIIWFVLRRRKKKKELLEAMEDDDE